MTRISVITAFLNEAENLPVLRQRVEAVFTERPEELEIVLVDDGSTDASSALAAGWARESSHIQYVRLSRNFGSHAAFSAGLAHATGDAVVLLAADLQDPPETIPPLLEKWYDGSDVVWAARAERRGEAWTTKLFAGAYYWMMRRMALGNMHAKGADFLLLDRQVVNVYNAISEKHTSFFAMILWMGFRQATIHYVKQERLTGTSKWTLAKKVKLLVDSLVSFSYAPIRLMSLLGFAMALAGFVYAAVVVIGRLTGWVVSGLGFAAIMTVLLLGQGMILMMLGVLGEYLWRTFDESRGRPRYIVHEHIARRRPEAEDEPETGSGQTPAIRRRPNFQR